LLSACAATQTEGAQVAPNRLEQAVVIGRSSKAQVLAALGPTARVAFDSGYEVWMYNYPAGGMLRLASGKADESYGEFVILFDRAGMVRKIRRREPVAK
jgi:hypothetical protein